MNLELRRELRRAVETLPRTQRRIVQALLREPQSYEALSRELDASPGAASDRYGPDRACPAGAARAQPAPAEHRHDRTARSPRLR